MLSDYSGTNNSLLSTEGVIFLSNSFYIEIIKEERG